ncbi:hypothetical protein ACFQZO_36730 [Bradyrhizobium sp. GCM10027634]|uniref:hypothetical protein n=1 Tax=unclassified Bradyrhizobium TaxID=2631580 RepID=UPI00263B372D|nr:hypothetical protein [Bradyrhizobium sp. WYCCWR 12677]MDN5006371.1 hypothetical protein [Bradyrhizobium sp. WYCCWR 12677]
MLIGRNPVLSILPPRLVAAVVLLASATVLASSLILKMDRGFDFTDEAFYLMLAQRPAEYDLILGLFSYAIHPLYLFAGQSVSAFNRIGAFILSGLGVSLGWAVLMRLKLSWRDPDAILIVGTALLAPFFYYTYWIPTPSYNWLVLVAGWILALGLVLLQSVPAVSAFVAALAIAIALFTRPLNATAYGAIYLLGILCAFPDNRARLAQLGRTFLFGSGFLLALAASLPLGTIVNQINGYFAVFGGSHPNPFSMRDQQIEFLREGWVWWTSAALLLVCMFARYSGRTLVARWGEWAAFSVVVLLGLSLLRRSFDPGNCYVFSVLGGGGFAMLSIACRRDISLKWIALLALIGVIPWAATLGSAGRVCLQVAFFPGLSLMVLIIATALVLPRSFGLTLAGFVGLYLVYSATAAGLASPYRLAAPLGLQTLPTEVGTSSTLKLDERTRRFIQMLQADVASRGFCRDDLAIDLSGEVPGAVFAIGGRMPVFPWIFAGYPSSHRLASEYLRMVGPERLRRAWLILGTGGHSLKKEEWEGLGLDFASHPLVDNLTHPVDGSVVQLYAPAVERAPC